MPFSARSRLGMKAYSTQVHDSLSKAIASSPSPNPRDWLPIRIPITDGNPEVLWSPVGENAFKEPFFEDSLRRSHTHPTEPRPIVRTTLEALDEPARSHTGPFPRLAGIIHHWSRCGSTLVAQMIAEIPHTIVLSEPPPLESLLALAHSHPARFASAMPRILRSLVSAWATAFSDFPYLVLKTDAWHVVDWALFETAFPNTPAIFVYRRPVETLVSHQRRRGWHMVPGAIPSTRLGIAEEAMSPSCPWEVHAARVLAQLGQSALNATATTSLRLVHYPELPQIVTERILDLFQIESTLSDRKRMLQRTERHGKHPEETFQPDAETKRGEAPDSLVRAAEAHAAETYQALETRRLSGRGLSHPGLGA